MVEQIKLDQLAAAAQEMINAGIGEKWFFHFANRTMHLWWPGNAGIRSMGVFQPGAVNGTIETALCANGAFSRYLDQLSPATVLDILAERETPQKQNLRLQVRLFEELASPHDKVAAQCAGSKEEWHPPAAFSHLPGGAALGRKRAASVIIEEIFGRYDSLRRCQADRDGDCEHPLCPQITDGEPDKTGRHCPLDCDDEPLSAEKPSDCGCKPFCEVHGRDYIDTEEGFEYCAECVLESDDPGELCHPGPNACHDKNPEANLFERQFMCPVHAVAHAAFCAECGMPEQQAILLPGMPDPVRGA